MLPISPQSDQRVTWEVPIKNIWKNLENKGQYLQVHNGPWVNLEWMNMEQTKGKPEEKLERANWELKAASRPGVKEKPMNNKPRANERQV